MLLSVLFAQAASTTGAMTQAFEPATSAPHAAAWTMLLIFALAGLGILVGVLIMVRKNHVETRDRPPG